MTEEEIRKLFAKNLKIFRKEKKISAEMAAVSGIWWWRQNDAGFVRSEK